MGGLSRSVSDEVASFTTDLNASLSSEGRMVNTTLVTNNTFLSQSSLDNFRALMQGLTAWHENFDSTTQAIVITIFALLIAFGATGNSLVCYVVVRNPAMRTPRNIFIINLAISDLTLCLFTQPFNLMKVLSPAWKLGTFMCKFIPMFCGVNVFVSTISITAIALDRFQVIVYPTNNSMKRFGALLSLISVWLVSMVLASPMAVFNVVRPFRPFALIPSIVLYEVCIEDLEYEHFRRVYSIGVIIVQYLLPVAIVIAAHVRISRKLRNRMQALQQRNQAEVTPTNVGARHQRQKQGPCTASKTTGGVCQVPLSAAQKEKRRLAQNRKRKTTLLLVMIAVVFALSWLPLIVYNAMADFLPEVVREIDRQSRNLAFPVCHMLVLCSACFNPLLYGWLNDNFRREFVKVLCSCCGRPCCHHTPVLASAAAATSKSNFRQVPTAVDEARRLSAALVPDVASGLPPVPLGTDLKNNKTEQ